jgi:hypothetical protein
MRDHALTMINKPTPKPAVIYNQDTLYDYANSGGCVESLLEGELRNGNRVVMVQEPTNAPSTVWMVLETMEDFKRWKESRLKMRDWFRKIFRET